MFYLSRLSGTYLKLAIGHQLKSTQSTYLICRQPIRYIIMTKRNTYTHLSQSDTAIQIERLVQAIEQHDSAAFRFRQRIPDFR